jgi:hypothetical protein
VRPVNSAKHPPVAREIPNSAQPAAKRPRQPKVDEAAVAAWLGSDDLCDVAPQSKTHSKLEATSKTASDQVATDDAILSRIGDRLAERGIASFTRIGIDIKHGVVTVRGTVASKGERLLLMHILRETPGVRTIQDGLSVKSVTAPRQSWGDWFGSLTSNISVPSLPDTDNLPSMTEWFSSLKPIHGGIAAAVLLVAAFFFWPRGPQHVAVYPLQGRVVIGGAPMAQATVVLHPTGPSKLPSGILPRGTATEDGNVIFQTFAAADGSPEGEYIATVHLMKPVIVDGDSVPGPDTSPAIYRVPETSPFRLQVTRETKQISQLELLNSVVGVDN